LFHTSTDDHALAALTWRRHAQNPIYGCSTRPRLRQESGYAMQRLKASRITVDKLGPLASVLSFEATQNRPSGHSHVAEGGPWGWQMAGSYLGSNGVDRACEGIS